MTSELTADQMREEWIARLTDLIQQVQQWAQAIGWSTKRIEIQRDDSQIGRYKAPALLMQDESIRILLEPIARSAPGAQGVVDLYLMPAYDDIASLYFYDDCWHIHYGFSEDQRLTTVREAKPKALSKESLQEVLEAMKVNAIQ